MRNRRGMIDKKPGTLTHIIKAVLWCVGLVLAGTAVVAWLIDAETIGIEYMAYGVLAVLLISSFVSAIIAVSGMFQMWKALLIHAGCIMICLVMGNLVLGIGRVEGILPAMLVVCCGCACAALMRLRPKKINSYLRRK